MCPPTRVTASLASARPIPRPLPLVLEPTSKALSINAGGSPGPSSRTTKCTVSMLFSTDTDTRMWPASSRETPSTSRVTLAQRPWSDPKCLLHDDRDRVLVLKQRAAKEPPGVGGIELNLGKH